MSLDTFNFSIEFLLFRFCCFCKKKKKEKRFIMGTMITGISIYIYIFFVHFLWKYSFNRIKNRTG